MSKELKPCPFCGGEAVAFDGWDSFRIMHTYGVCCTKCSGKQFKPEYAISHWNRRPLEDEKDREIKRLKEKLNSLKQEIIENRDKYMKLTEHDDFTTATLAFGGYNLLNSFIEIINATDNNVGSMEKR